MAELETCNASAFFALEWKPYARGSSVVAALRSRDSSSHKSSALQTIQRTRAMAHSAEPRAAAGNEEEAAPPGRGAGDAEEEEEAAV